MKEAKLLYPPHPLSLRAARVLLETYLVTSWMFFALVQWCLPPPLGDAAAMVTAINAPVGNLSVRVASASCFIGSH